MRRRTRFIAAVVAAIALLSSQLAVAAYACAMVMEGIVADAEAQDGASDGLPNALLCKLHCDYGEASVDALKQAPAEVPLVGPTLRITSSILPTERLEILSSRFPPPPYPPPLVRFSVLRI